MRLFSSLLEAAGIVVIAGGLGMRWLWVGVVAGGVGLVLLGVLLDPPARRPLDGGGG